MYFIVRCSTQSAAPVSHSTRTDGERDIRQQQIARKYRARSHLAPSTNPPQAGTPSQPLSSVLFRGSVSIRVHEMNERFDRH